MAVISVYAPTPQVEPNTKDTFYNELQDLVNRVLRRDIFLIAGDWNSRTRPTDEYTHHILGRFGFGEQCENVDRFVSLANLNRLVATSTRFKHPKRHLLTGHFNDGRTVHQINYILVHSRRSLSTEGYRLYRGGITGNVNGTDHTLVHPPQASPFTMTQKPTLPQSRRAQVNNPR